ncbi:MAG: alpha/beta fold hydrolase [Chitinophagaceae bacterium]|nr:alpha/beta fold hydrolase [Chitinophagaceae bacterium]
MKRAAFIFLLLPAFSFSNAQSYAGITGVRDTSYNMLNEFNKHLKNYPAIQIVKEKSYQYIAEEKNIAYCHTKERELKLDVFYPTEKTEKKRTAVIFIHGGGWRSGNKAMHYPLLQELAALGYVCITPEYRLSTEALYPAAIHDIKSAIRWVRKNAAQYRIDVNKIVAAGHSSGGELAAFMGATNGMKQFEGEGGSKDVSSKVNAVIDLDGTLVFIHPESGEGDDSKRISAATYWFGYSKTENPELWKQAAPLTHVGKHTPPTQFINSSVTRMHAGREDFIAVLKQNKIYNETRTLEGSPHSFLLFNPWFDTTVVYMDNFLCRVFPADPKKFTKEITVAQDGSGDYKTVQAAINAVPLNNKKPVAIIIKKGVYKEKILVDSLHPFITIIGEDKLNTVLTYNDHTGKIAPNGDTINTRTSWSFKVLADNFTATDITFQNDAGFSAGQAVAVESNGDKAIFKNCRFIGNQDVLFTNSDRSRQYYENCYIEGTTDFIFGSSTAWFQKCRIYSKKNSHITAASTPKEKEFGYVFNWCELDGDTSLHNVSLGRPWRPYAAVAYLHCYIGQHIKAEGWSVWNNNENHLTSRYAEFANFGPSSKPEGRVNWAKQLTTEEAKNYTLTNVLQGWNPLK